MTAYRESAVVVVMLAVTIVVGSCARCEPVDPTCGDGAQNGDETGLDCGGGCEPCALDVGCLVGADCESLFCRSGTCAVPRTCAEIHASSPDAVSGVYEITPFREPRQVYCDMTTDNGGWTLVASTAVDAPDDMAADYFTDLATIWPEAQNPGVWDEMRAVVVSVCDIRFTCKVNLIDAGATVDLSMYAADWYLRITSGSDASSCFFPYIEEGHVPPARRNNLTGETRDLGDDWDRGDFVGEDTCSDGNDFSVDFDDQGLDSNEQDGTDWGLDDGTAKCGTSMDPVNGAWFIWVRE